MQNVEPDNTLDIKKQPPSKEEGCPGRLAIPPLTHGSQYARTFPFVWVFVRLSLHSLEQRQHRLWCSVRLGERGDTGLLQDLHLDDLHLLFGKVGVGDTASGRFVVVH